MADPTSPPAAPRNRGGRPRSTFPAVPHAQVGGVTVGTHTLTKTAEVAVSITRRVMLRLSRWLAKHPDVIPDADFVEAFRYHQAALIGFLKEQRERAKDGGPPVPTEVLDAQMRHQFVLAAGTFTESDLEILGRGLSEAAWQMLDRIRGERFGAGEWIPATDAV